MKKEKEKKAEGEVLQQNQWGMRISRGADKVVQISFAVVWGALVISALVSINTVYPVETAKQNLLAAGMLAILLGLGFALAALLGKNQRLLVFLRDHPWRVFLPLLLLVFLLQLWLLGRLQLPFWGWDAGMVLGVAGMPNMSENPVWLDYFSHYSNNLFLLFVCRGYILFIDAMGIPRQMGLTILNVVAVNVAIVFLFAAAKRLYGGITALAAGLMGILVMGFFPWLLVPYSDTLSLPFIAGAACLYVFCWEEKRLGRRLGKAAAIGVLLAVAFFIKPTAVVLAIAIVLVQGVGLLAVTGAGRKKALLAFATAVLTGAVLLGGVRWYMAGQTMVKLTPGLSVPMEHFMSMGLKERGEGNARLFGAWDGDDVAETWVLQSTEEMRIMNREKWVSRIAEMGLDGYLPFLWNKLRWISLDGSFFWGGEGTNAEFENQSQPLAKWVYPTGPYYPIYRHGPQAVWLCVLFFSLVPAVLGLWRKQPVPKPEVVLQLAILGLLCFVLLFEGRSRYLISYLPFFCILAGRGYALIGQFLYNKLGQCRTIRKQTRA